MTEYVIAFDCLPKATNLNARDYWRTRAEWNRVCKDEAIMACREQLPPTADFPGPAAIELVFFLPDKRRRDLDNLVASCKPYLDGLVHCGVVRDDDVRSVYALEARSEIRHKAPGFEIRVRPNPHL